MSFDDIGNSFNCKWLLPYCLIKLKKKDAALVLWKYLKGANFFNQSNGDAIGTSLLSDVDMAWNSVQDTKLRFSRINNHETENIIMITLN